MKDVSIIIPVYNESSRIGSVLSRVPKEFGKAVIVVDDGSTDGTSSIAKKMGFNVMRLNPNRGKAYACMEGMKRAKNYCIFIDGDGQLDPHEIPRFVRALGNADLAIGRRNTAQIPLHRRFTNWCSRKAVTMITGADISDVLCGFRGIRKESFRKMHFSKSGYFLEVEMILEALDKKMKIVSVPVSVSYDVGSRMPLKKSLEIAIWLSSKCLGKIFNSCKNKT